MKTVFTKLISLCAVMLCFFAVATVSASAAGSVSLNVSPKNAGVGETINVHIEFTSDNMDIQYAEANLEYDSSVIEVASDSQTSGSGGIVRLRGYASDAPSITFDVKFTAIKEGACDLVIADSSATDMSNNSLGSPTANAIVSIGDESNLDSDSTLKTINVSEGTLSPAFSPEITAYTVEVPNDVSTISIQGQTSNTKSYIYFSGGFDGGLKELDGTSPKIYEGQTSLREGDNVKTITVTAENGDERAYTITVVRLAAGEQTSLTTPTSDSTAGSNSQTPSEGTSDESSSENDMNLFVTSASNPSSSSSTSPQNDKILNDIFPIVILGIFVVAIVIFVVISALKLRADKKKREQEERRRRTAQQKRRAAQQMEDYNNRINNPARQPSQHPRRPQQPRIQGGQNVQGAKRASGPNGQHTQPRRTNSPNQNRPRQSGPDRPSGVNRPK